nr:MAG TPA: hypothetical protein [Caudoviricetes sp.]DAM58439.1 MAG TPA: hypothetical protein [Caudoviricetes sp.]
MLPDLRHSVVVKRGGYPFCPLQACFTVTCETFQRLAASVVVRTSSIIFTMASEENWQLKQ